MSTGKHSDRVDQAVRAVPPLSHLFFPAPSPRSERLEQAIRAWLTGDIFCCTYVSCAKKKLLYIISFKVHVILSLMRGRGTIQNAERLMTVPYSDWG